MLQPPDPAQVASDVVRALAEDLGSGDSTAALVPDGKVTAHIVSKDSARAVLAGVAWAEACFRSLDPDARVDWHYRDGECFERGDALCTVAGEARALLSAERSALNFLQTLSGTATVTAAYVSAIAESHCRILDTRKTLPGLRYAQKYAVRAGGGNNHRMGLFDAVLIKENHIAAAGSIAAAVDAARVLAPSLLVEVEVENIAELELALAAAPDRIMLDEFSAKDRARAVALTRGRIPLEVSGNVTIESIGDIARSGVDFISVGAITKHVRAIDLSLRIEKPQRGAP